MTKGNGAGHDGPSLPAVPPEWVRLADAPAWIASIVGNGISAQDLWVSLVLAVRDKRFPRHRIPNVRPHPTAFEEMPPGLAFLSKDERPRSIVTDWAAARFDDRSGTVAGRRVAAGERERKAIEILWADVEQWVALDLRRSLVGGSPPAPINRPDPEAPPEDAAEKAAAFWANIEAAPAVSVSKAPAPIKPIRGSNYVSPPPKPAPWSAPPPPPAGSAPGQAPLQWVPLADVPGWIAYLHGQHDPELLPWLVIEVRSPHTFFAPRIPNVDPRSWGGERLPAGLAWSGGHHEKFPVYVSDWDEATVGCLPGTVNGWDGQRHPVAVQWEHVCQWLPQYRVGAQARQRERDKAGAAAKEAAEEKPAAAPPGRIFIDSAVDRIKERLGLSDGLAIERLMKALVAEGVQSWGRRGLSRIKLTADHLKTVVVDLNEFRASGHSGLRLWGNTYHLHAIEIDQEDFRCCLDGLKVAPTAERVATEGPAPAEAEGLPPCDLETAKGLLAGMKARGGWRTAPTWKESRDLLRRNFSGVPSDLHSAARVAVWGEQKRGPKAKAKK